MLFSMFRGRIARDRSKAQALHLEILEDRRLLSVFTVTNTDDSGAGSLRQAILDSNANPGSNTIQFAIDSGAQTIAPSSALPTITQPVLIDGTTQPGFAGTPLIEIDGTNVPTYGAGLTVSAGSTTIQGLVVSGFRGNGIALTTNGDDIIRNDFIGTDITGTVMQANGGEGILVASNDNLIGGIGAGNVISGNTLRGINLAGTGNVVQGNWIGTDVTGSLRLGNAGGGLFVGSGSNLIGGTDPGAGNIISANGSIGITIASAGNQVQGNTIGLDVTGSVALGNASDGVEINAGASNNSNIIGGTAPGAGNVISANPTGVAIFGAGNIVQGNLIGTDVTGTVALGNTFSGVDIGGGFAANNLIGGTDPGAGNTIAANGAGVTLRFGSGSGNVVQGNLIGTDVTGTVALANHGAGVDLQGNDLTLSGNVISGNAGDGVLIHQGATDIVVQGNLIGTDATGMQALGNSANGIHIQGPSSSNVIGGTDPGAANVIAYNGQDGILVDRAIGNAIQENSIFGNLNRGIKLLNHGNLDQAAPALSSATSDGNTTTVAGTLTSTPDTTFTVEFFANADAGTGEGEQFLGSIVVTTDDNGVADVSVTLAIGFAPGQYITTTATDPNGNTSEFSAAVVVTSADSVSGAAARSQANFDRTLATAIRHAQDAMFQQGPDAMWS
jgi:titin